jgi:D-alanine-D-alanine ligase
MKKDQISKKAPNGHKKPNQGQKTLGPVGRLEEHVRPEWWREIFSPLYLKTDGDVVDDAGITSEEVTALCEVLDPAPDARILDCCCGQGRHTLELARRGYAVEGLDRSHYLIQKARTAARKEGLPVRFREGDAKQLPYRPDTFDAVAVLGNSFGYFETVHEDLRVLTEIRRVLKPYGKIVLDLADGGYLREHFQPRSWEWIDTRLFVCRERELSMDRQRLVSREVICDIEKGVIADQFYAERLYTRERITELLEKAGFSEVAVHPFEARSNRNQDLGMMARRFLVSGVVKKEWTPVKPRGAAQTRHVAVLMGDPRKPDPVKPDGAFDEDDFHTIDQLKAALAGLKGYHFTFVDNHDTLISDLQRTRAKIDYVLNLCDEGYANDALKELHVPALLEMLQFPYTGAGPQALAKCFDKSLVRGIARELGVPVPRGIFVHPWDRVYDVPFGFPVIIKPNFGDSSIGITQKSVAWTAEELSNAILTIRSQLGSDVSLLAEEFCTGKDITVGIIGNPPAPCSVLPVIEEDYSSLPPGLPRICGYEAKWIPESPYWQLASKPADLTPEAEKLVVRCSLLLFERLGCRDYCRFDWRLDAEGQPRLLEVNPNPGWCWDGHLAKMSKFAGISYTEMLGMILAAAESRLGMVPLITPAVETEPMPVEADSLP